MRDVSPSLYKYICTTAHSARKGRYTFHCITPMFIYQPNQYSDDRVVWHGGESTQLHYEQEHADAHDNPMWSCRDTRILGRGIPVSMSEFHRELVDYYNYCQVAVHV